MEIQQKRREQSVVAGLLGELALQKREKGEEVEGKGKGEEEEEEEEGDDKNDTWMKVSSGGGGSDDDAAPPSPPVARLLDREGPRGHAPEVIDKEPVSGSDDRESDSPASPSDAEDSAGVDESEAAAPAESVAARVARTRRSGGAGRKRK